MVVSTGCCRQPIKKYGSITRQVENIIRGTKGELEESAQFGKFNYYGKRYRFEEEE